MKKLIISFLAISSATFAGISNKDGDDLHATFEAGEVIPLKIKLTSQTMEFKDTIDLTFKKTTHVRVEPKSGIFISNDGKKWTELKAYFGPTGYAGGFWAGDNGEFKADYEIIAQN